MRFIASILLKIKYLCESISYKISHNLGVKPNIVAINEQT